MKYVGVLTLLAVLLSWLTNSSPVAGISSSLVISQIQLGAPGTSKQEFVQLHNNTAQELDVTDWCLVYSDYKDETQTTLKCFALPSGVDGLKLPAHGNLLVVSQTYPLPLGIVTSERFGGTSTDMSGARGHVRILNANGNEVDKVAWDNGASSAPVSPEGLPAAAPATGKSISRNGTLVQVDTDDNFLDFHETVASPLSSDLFEFVEPEPIIDLCQQDGVQATMPDGYGYDEAGNCELISDDLCQNLLFIQVTVPDGMLAEAGDCYEDACRNLDGLQIDTPVGYIQIQGTCTVLENRALVISELLANASGTDTGQEYIEVYNPFDEAILLNGYVLHIGKDFEKSYELIADGLTEYIAPHSFRYFSDDVLGFTLLNTTSGVRLSTPAGNLASETSYENPKDDMSWSRFDDSWSYTNRPTPGYSNELYLSIDEEVVLGTVSTLAPCGEGKYRHPITNRCRNVEADASALASCDADEYRNPETNRCRKLASLASATLAECEEGYERNTATNRCRKIATLDTELRPCEAGYERNAETNRCRAVASQNSTRAGLTNEAAPDGSLNWPAVGVIATIAVGYALYEWRSEFMKGTSRLRAKFTR